MRVPSVGGATLTRTLAAFALFITVDYGYWAVLLLYMFERGGAALASATLIAQMVPAAILAPALGSLGDRFPRGKVLSITYAVEAVLLGALALAMATNASTSVVIATAILLNLAASTCEPLHFAILPQVCAHPSNLVRANSLSNQLDSIGIFIGPVIAGSLSAGGHFELVVGIFAIALAIASVCTLRLPDTGRSPSEEHSGLRQAARGISAIASDRPLLVLVLLLLLVCVTSGSLEILATSFATDVLNGDEATAGLLMGASGIGAFIGAGLIGLKPHPKLTPLVALGLTIAGIPLIVMALASHVIVAVLLLALTGGGIAVARTAISSLTQRTTATHLLTRMFAIEFSALLIGWAIGTALGPVLIDVVGASHAYLPVGVVSITLTWLAWRFMRPLDGRTVTDNKILTTLGVVPFLAELGTLKLDLLARRCEWRDITAGTVLCREGSYDDELFIVDEGELTATTADGKDTSLQAGAWFEDAALSHTVPRSATLTAAQTSRVLVVSRAAFLAAVRGRPGGGAFVGLLSDDELEVRVVASLTKTPATAAELEKRLGVEPGSLETLLSTLCEAGELRLTDGVYEPSFGNRRHSSLPALELLDPDQES